MFPSLWKVVRDYRKPGSNKQAKDQGERSNYSTMSMLWFSIKLLCSSRKRVYIFVGICDARNSHEDCKRGQISSLLEVYRVWSVSTLTPSAFRSSCKRSINGPLYIILLYKETFMYLQENVCFWFHLRLPIYSSPYQLAVLSPASSPVGL